LVNVFGVVPPEHQKTADQIGNNDQTAPAVFHIQNARQYN